MTDNLDRLADDFARALRRAYPDITNDMAWAAARAAALEAESFIEAAGRPLGNYRAGPSLRVMEDE